MLCVCRGRKFDGGSSAEFLQALHAADTEVGTGPEAGPERGAPAFHCCASWSQGGACWESASRQRLQGNCFDILRSYWSVQLYTLCVSISFCYTLKLLFIRFWLDQIRWVLDRQNFGWIKVCRLFQELIKKCLNIITQNWY